ncbi:MAG TPA: protein kinase [Terriglobales bacterium]|nr:protein kinase [Terriglobales bacterium]
MRATMPISAGTKLGPYEVQGVAGSGGMGEVYRARDSRLDRAVAIKVLPDLVAGDEDRLRRFEQEARVIAALNHPNILSIHDTGALDGSRYLVTELLEGDTLRDRLAGGPLPVRKAVDYALQICRGLSAAHEKGITHRDIKPENIFLTRDGRVKILDFGLAKQGSAATAAAATVTHQRPLDTSPGTVMGTVGYMSPEQVRGKPVDQRTDIFALGAVLYEMLSGRRAFHGDTAADTMSAILKEDPPDLTETNRNLPPGLERIVRHCLEKNPEERFQSAHDIVFALDALTGISTTSGKAARVDLGPRVKIRLAAAVLAAAAALALGLAMGMRASRATPPHFQPVTFRLGWMGDARFTPDGDMVYSAAWDGKLPELYVGRQGSPGDRALGISGADVLSVSKNGELAILLHRAYVSGYAFRGTLARVPLSGGAPRTVLDDVQYAEFSPDGSQMVITRYNEATGSWRLEYPIGTVLYETKGWVSHPKFSPRGDRIAFMDHPAPQGDDRGEVAVIDLQGHKQTLGPAFNSVQGIVWHGDEIWFTASEAGISRQLYAVTLSGKQRLLLSAPSNLLLEDVNDKGQLLVRSENQRIGALGVAPGEARERELAWFNWSIVRDITPDGKTLLLEEQGDAAGTNYLIYIRGTDGSPAVRLGEGQAFRISPDGKWVLSALPGSGHPLRLIPTGAGEPREITHDKMDDHDDPRWFPDGKRVLFVGIEAGHGPRNYLLDVDTGQARPVTPEGTRGTVLSPDGKLAAVLTADGSQAFWPLDGGEMRPIKGVNSNEWVFAWTADGKSLYVTPISGPDSLPRKVFILDPASGQRRLWKTFSPSDLTGIRQVSAPVISNDGRAYAYGYSKSLSDLYIVEGVK